MIWIIFFEFFLMRLDIMDNIQFFIVAMIIWTVIAGYLFYKLFRIALGKDNSTSATYNYDVINAVIIHLLPMRVTFLSLLMICFSSMVLYTVFLPSLLTIELSDIDFYKIDTYLYQFLNVLLLFLFLFLLFSGLKLFIRRNNVIQLEIDNIGIKYMDIDWRTLGKQGTISIVTMYFSKKYKFVAYREIINIYETESTSKGRIINIATYNQTILLPFLPDDNGEFDAVKMAIQNRFEKYKQ